MASEHITRSWGYTGTDAAEDAMRGVALHETSAMSRVEHEIHQLTRRLQLFDGYESQYASVIETIKAKRAELERQLDELRRSAA